MFHRHDGVRHGHLFQNIAILWPFGVGHSTNRSSMILRRSSAILCPAAGYANIFSRGLKRICASRVRARAFLRPGQNGRIQFANPASRAIPAGALRSARLLASLPSGGTKRFSMLKPDHLQRSRCRLAA